MGCVLRIDGDFDPEPILRRAGRREKADGWRRGAARPTSGLRIVVSDAPFDDLAAQVAEAVEFLGAEQETLREIMEGAGVESGVLDFGVAQRALPAFFLRFPARLVELAGRARLGFEVSLYAVSGLGGAAGPDPAPDPAPDGGRGGP